MMKKNWLRNRKDNASIFDNEEKGLDICDYCKFTSIRKTNKDDNGYVVIGLVPVLTTSEDKQACRKHFIRKEK